jgi:hypothetical protein
MNMLMRVHDRTYTPTEREASETHERRREFAERAMLAMLGATGRGTVDARVLARFAWGCAEALDDMDAEIASTLRKAKPVDPVL